MDMQIRAISEKNNIKMAVVDITESLAEIVKLQGTNPLTSVALGRALINNALISLSLKDGNKMTTNLNGMGFAGTIITEFQNNTIRGYVENPDFDATQISEEKGDGSPLSQTVGTNGFLQVSRYDQDKKEPYTSRVELISGEINLDYMYYLQKSDQIHSLITSTVEIDDKGGIEKAVGIIIQLLPGYTEENISFIEEKVGSIDYLKKILIETTNYEALLKDIAQDAKVWVWLN
ncbi:heat shock protein 33 [Spiroplasma clarkii]|nr:Hsp33 family molecular chaperone HslO [Spiroplasma clarkii]ARU90899.1 heat shock protein 33 [Spiroplasma clarkii]